MQRRHCDRCATIEAVQWLMGEFSMEGLTGSEVRRFVMRARKNLTPSAKDRRGRGDDEGGEMKIQRHDVGSSRG